jgi:pimeloyl-ACP methyl ester carboxylesterase
MDWARDLRGWSHPEWSRQVLSRPHRWHVQETGEGPLLLWLHGAGATTHSWRDLWPQLPGFRHVGVDLPGHGFTRLGTRLRSGLLPMSEDIAALCASQGWQPVAVIGHSAGAALALQLADKVTAPDGGPVRIVGLNASLTPFEGGGGLAVSGDGQGAGTEPADGVEFFAGLKQVGHRAAGDRSDGIAPQRRRLRLLPQATACAMAHCFHSTVSASTRWSISASLCRARG